MYIVWCVLFGWVLVFGWSEPQIPLHWPLEHEPTSPTDLRRRGLRIPREPLPEP
jgi:hypothetical protein